MSFVSSLYGFKKWNLFSVKTLLDKYFVMSDDGLMILIYIYIYI